MKTRLTSLLMVLLWMVPTGIASAQPAAQLQLATVSAALNFKTVKPGQDAALAVVVDIKSGYHAQSNKPLDQFLIPFAVTLENNPNFEVLPAIYPSPVIENYPQLGTISVYNGKVTAYVPLRVRADAKAGAVQLKGTLRIQICDDRVCFQPQNRPISVEFTVASADGNAEPANAELFSGYKGPSTAPATQQAASEAPPTKSSSVVQSDLGTTLGKFGLALLAGLLFNIMPCVLPVLPLKIVGFYEAAQHSRSRAFALGLVFSAGVISVFVVLSVLVVVLKAFAWGDLFRYGWFIWGMVVLLLFLAAGLMGGWNLSLPVGIYSFEPRHDTFGGNFFWGALSAILATPCTAPLLPGVLLWATQQATAIGVTTVVLVGAGMAFPYLLLSAFPEVARKFPRTGPFSELFKQMMGFMLIATAAYFGAGRIIAGPQFFWVVTAVIGIAAIYLVARTAQLYGKAIPIAVSAIIGVGMLGGAVAWSAGMASNPSWEHFTQARFDELRSSGKPVLVKFTANWCGTCQYIERTVYTDSKVWKRINADGIATLKVDLTHEGAPGSDLLLSLNPSGGIPLTAIWVGGAPKPILLESFYTSSELMQTIDGAEHPGANETAANASAVTTSSTRNPS